MIDKNLQEYRKKRNFAATPEPQGKKIHKKSPFLNFVIQKHAASHLHYDFRLEMNGVLKSWAIPKGPSLNSQDKRLAIETEDHPLEYQNFEGIIPPGNYGAGTVLIWDKGAYEPITGESSPIEGYNKGHLPIILHGKKLKGGFMLQRLKKANPSRWLLIKLKDKYEKSHPDITKDNRSVVSGKTLNEINSGANNE